MMSHTGHASAIASVELPLELESVTTNSFAVRRDEAWGWHRHDAHELLWGTRGSLVVETAGGVCAVPWTVGLWVPAGEPHRVAAGPGTTFACTFVPPKLGAPRPDVGAVSLSLAVRALLAELEAHDLDPDTRALAERLVIRMLERAELPRLDLPMPVDDRARRVADHVLAHPADPRTLQEWGALVGASERNLSRLFHRETGLTFAEWRTKARMRLAIEMLAAEHPVGAVARRVGYGTASAFVHAFRRELGTTPGALTGTAAGSVSPAPPDGGSATSS